MSRPRNDIEARLRELTPPSLPGDLKGRVMAAAGLAPRASWRDRAWYSSAWRIAAAGALVVIVGADRWSGTAFRVEIGEPVAAAVEEPARLAALGMEMGLPAETMAQLTSRVEFLGLSAPESAAQAGAALR